MNEDRAQGAPGAATGAGTSAGAGAGAGAATGTGAGAATGTGAGAAAGGARLTGGARGAVAGGVAALAVLLGMALVFGLRLGPMAEAPTAAPEAGALPETAAGEAARPVGLMATPQDGAEGAAPSDAPAESAVAATPEGGDPAAASDAAAPAAASGASAATDAAADAADVARFDQLRASADGMITLAGRAEPGAKVEVLLDGQVIDTVTALAGGSFASVADAGAAVAGRLLTVRVTGADGVARDSAASAILDPGADPGADPGDGAPAIVVDAAEGARVLDAAAPAQLVIDTFTAAETAAGGVISGRGAPAGSLIRAYLDGAEAGLTVPRADGSWMIALPDMAPGTHLLRIDALDAAGKVLARAETDVLKPAAEAGAAVAGAPAGEAAAGDTAPLDAAAIAAATTGAEAETASDAVGGGEVALAAADPTATATAIDTPAPKPAPAAAPAVPSDASGATDAAPATPPAPEGAARLTQIEVRPGDTLWAIAGARYGDPLLYVQVFRANAGQIRDPDKIYPGQVFTLPE